ncbi:hypothetical protein GYMLUDRAFT_56605 [Collybiopsis luxurians FD-317 M1]|nr:hypothetical protein GYMLUDRAFT_56605 [Collybiopsis luxurians FD-317 M1]
MPPSEPASYAAILARTASQPPSSGSSDIIEIDSQTLLPSTFQIGDKVVTPFVTIPEIVNHLKVLACLRKLQEDVRNCSAPSNHRPLGKDSELHPDTKWWGFCTRAAHRFEELATSSAFQSFRGPADVDVALCIMDIDTLMIWHGYMLNPRWYKEDLEREGLLEGLKALGKFPLEAIVRRIDPANVYHKDYSKSSADEDGRLFRPSLSNSSSTSTHPKSLIEMHPVDTTITIQCPNCPNQVEVPLFRTSATPNGFCGPSFIHTCSGCGFKIDHDALKMAKFLRDIVSVSSGRTEVLAGMAYDQSTGLEYSHAMSLSNVLVYGVEKVALENSKKWIHPHTKNYDASWKVSQLGHVFKWDLNNMKRRVFEEAREKENYGGIFDDSSVTDAAAKKIVSVALNRLQQAYSYSGIASLDLGQAAMRQAGFISKVHQIGWLKMQRWEGKSRTRFYPLQKAAERYRMSFTFNYETHIQPRCTDAFLDLMKAHPTVLMCPTLDIDLAWHSHQLHGLQYVLDNVTHVSRLIDHDDRISDVILADAYTNTAQLWAKRFFIPYSFCGCPQPKEHLEKALQNMTGRSWKVWKKDKRAEVTMHRREVLNQKEYMMDPYEKEVNCPSAHNQVRVKGIPEMEQKRALRLASVRQRSHPDPFTATEGSVPEAAQVEVAEKLLEAQKRNLKSSRESDGDFDNAVDVITDYISSNIDLWNPQFWGGVRSRQVVYFTQKIFTDAVLYVVPG